MKNQQRLAEINWDFPDSNKSENIHSIHPYPAKFIPEIPRYLIRTLGVPKGTWVFDPFCGSGVTVVEGLQEGYPAIGNDLNPIASLITKVKTTPLPRNLGEETDNIIKNAKRVKDTEILVPNIPNLDHWYEKDIQIVISKILRQIKNIDDSVSRDCLRLALSSILVRVSNQDSDTRYAAVKKNVTGEDVYKFFRVAVDKIWKNMISFKPKTWENKILQQDILTVTEKDINVPVGIMITSPPYPNAFEYWLYHKYRMYWLGYDPLDVKRKEIGARAHYFKKNYPTDKDFMEQLGYLFKLTDKTLVIGGHICIVIGSSKIHGRIVDNAKLTIEMASKNGFKVVENIDRNIARTRKSFNLYHARIRKENVLIFRR